MSEEATGTSAPTQPTVSDPTPEAAAQVAPPGDAAIKGVGLDRTGPFSVPEEIRPTLEKMIPEGREWEVRKACAKSRFQKAVETGDSEEAIREDRVILSAMKEIDRCNKEVDALVRSAISNLPPEGEIRISLPEWTVDLDFSNAYQRVRR